MNEYGNFIRRADLIKNLIARQKLDEETATTKPNKALLEANKQRWLKYQELQRHKITAQVAAANSTGGPTDGGASYTARTTAFATATGITDTTILGALNTFDLGLISNGIDTKIKALYPFVGSTSTTQKYNFMDARDLDAAFRLQFFGGGTFSSNGYQPNGTNGYANSYYNQTTQGDSLSSGHLSYYSRSNTGAAGINIGTQQTSDVIKYNFLQIGNSASYYYPNSIGGTSFSDTDYRGFYVGNRNSLTNINFWKSGIKKVEGSFANYGNINVNIFIGAMSNNGSPSNYSNKECAFASIGNGLTDGEATTFYNLVQAMQTTLGRQV